MIKALLTGVLVAGRESPGGRLRSFDIAAIVQIDRRDVHRKPRSRRDPESRYLSYQPRRTACSNGGTGVGVVEFTYPNIIAL